MLGERTEQEAFLVRPPKILRRILVYLHDEREVQWRPSPPTLAIAIESDRSGIGACLFSREKKLSYLIKIVGVREFIRLGSGLFDLGL